MESAGGKTIRKFTVAGNKISVTPILEKLQKLEEGWGGPEHGTIIGSPKKGSSRLDLEQVVAMVIETL